MPYAPTNLDLLYDLAHDLLDSAAQILDDAGLDVPERQFVDTGTTAQAPVGFGDACESQLAVVVAGPRPSNVPTLSVTPPSNAKQQFLVWETTLTLSLTRCHPPAAEAAPSPEDLDKAAHDHLRDGWQLARGLGYALRAGTLLPSLGPVDSLFSIVRIGPLLPAGPSGGIAAWVVAVTLLLNDLYDPATAPEGTD